MFVHKIDEGLSLKLLELRDGEKLFELTNNSRRYLREWLPWLDTIQKSLKIQKSLSKCL